ncbi:MAG: phytoene desaturase [Chloroflexota bacterium]
MARVLVIGGGIGGLATAMRLQARGYQVTVIEARSRVGGRAYQFRDAGYTFDMGPTIITAPQLLHALWTATGGNLDNDVELVPLRPFYEICFADGIRFSYWGEPAAMEAEIARLSPADVAGYRRFLVASGVLYRRVFEQLAKRPFLSLTSFLKIIPDLVRLQAFRSVYSYIAQFFHDEHLRIAFSFHPLFIGGNPFRTSAIYSMVPYLEHEEGVWSVRGGIYTLVEAMARRLERLGGSIQCGDPVVEIILQGRQATGVRLRSGAVLYGDAIVSNADVANTYLKLLPAQFRNKGWGQRIRDMDYSMSCFIIYLGLTKRYQSLHHHTIMMPRDYRSVVEAIFRNELIEDDIALYIHAPSRTDPTLAPPGGETLYVLVPVPNLQANINWWAMKQRLREQILDILEHRLNLAGIRQHIAVERQFTPSDFAEELGSHLGAAFSIEPTLFQSAYFRPHNRCADVPGLYLVGAGTHPGAGLPGVLTSAEITAALVEADLTGLERFRARAASLRSEPDRATLCQQKHAHQKCYSEVD